MSKEKNGPRFTGGDDFSGFNKIVHDIMMTNELYNGYGAYKISYADTDDPKNKSGLSFGGNQMDMSKNSVGRELFMNILNKATDKNGKLIISKTQFDAICGKENINLKQTKKTPEEVFGKNLSFVNAALSSEYGIKEINKVYVQEVNKDIAHIGKAISLMQNPAAIAFYDNDAGRTWLYDYNNQCNCSPPIR